MIIRLNRNLLSINRVYNHIKADPKFAYVAKHPNVAGVAAQILQGMPRIVQTMYMRKDPAAEVGIGEQVSRCIKIRTIYLASQIP